MAVAILIALWIWDELSFNNYHSNHNQLAQVETTQTFNGQTGTGEAVAMPLGNELRTKYGSDFKAVSMASWNFGHILGFGEKKISVSGMWVESSFPEMFSLHMLKGTRKSLTDISSVLINASVAKALFGDQDPINKTLKVDNKLEFKVTGVYEDLPRNTSLYEMKILLPWEKYVTTENWLKNAMTHWGNHSFQAFVEVNNNGDIGRISEKIKKASMIHLNAATDGVEELVLQPMNNWRLHNEFKNGKLSGGRIEFVWLFGIIGIFVLLLACINFMNLSTARSEKRAKEVGIRKTVGSLRTQLIKQFLTESIVVAFLALAIAIVLVLALIPFFNSLSDKAYPPSRGKSVFLVIHPGVHFIYRLRIRQLSRFLFIGLRSDQGFKRHIPCGSLCSSATQNPGGCSIQYFHRTDHRHHHCLPPNSICAGTGPSGIHAKD